MTKGKHAAEENLPPCFKLPFCCILKPQQDLVLKPSRVFHAALKDVPPEHQKQHIHAPVTLI